MFVPFIRRDLLCPGPLGITDPKKGEESGWGNRALLKPRSPPDSLVRELGGPQRHLFSPFPKEKHRGIPLSPVSLRAPGSSGRGDARRGRLRPKRPSPQRRRLPGLRPRAPEPLPPRARPFRPPHDFRIAPFNLEQGRRNPHGLGCFLRKGKSRSRLFRLGRCYLEPREQKPSRIKFLKLMGKHIKAEREKESPTEPRRRDRSALLSAWETQETLRAAPPAPKKAEQFALGAGARGL